MLHPHIPPLTVQGLTSTWLMWVVMMTVMMLPTVLPWLVAFHGMHRDRHPDSALRRPVFFGLGYLTIWSVFSLVAAIGQVIVVQHGILAGATGSLSAPLAAALLIGAGTYQVSPKRAACLRRCRSPMSFFLTSWRSGEFGAMQMGMIHGRNCVTCCWALMLVSFALGVMNLLWMGILTLMIFLERWTRGGENLGRVFGIGLMVWGIWMVVG